MPRPSSALDAKASTMRPFYFNPHQTQHNIYSILKVQKAAVRPLATQQPHHPQAPSIPQWITSVNVHANIPKQLN